jgi:pSer/pThr/pTyr-binding forkhead associated (FHA) protein
MEDDAGGSAAAQGTAGLELRVVRGPGDGQRLPLRQGENLVGREGGNAHVQLDSVVISRRHVVLYVDGEAVVARDLASRNGTLVNGRRMRGTQLLRVGDRLGIGDLELVLARWGPADSPGPSGEGPHSESVSPSTVAMPVIRPQQRRLFRGRRQRS